MNDGFPTIRNMTRDDLPALRRVINATGLFPGDMLDGMASNFLAEEPESGFWRTLDTDGPQAVTYCAPERLTEGTWNMLLIAVLPSRQKHGWGAALVRDVEREAVLRGGRLLLVETSGLAEFDGTRMFYRRCGYAEEARIRDFYRTGEDKIVFRKPLTDTV